MALPTNNSRPAIPYVPAQVLPNYNRYQSLGKFPPTPQQLDGDLNAIMDFINTLSQAINETAAAGLPGAANPLNANALVTTDGAGNISWTLVNAANLDVNAIQTQNIQNQAITPPKIQVRAVGTQQIALGGVLTENIGVGAVMGNNISNYTIPLLKLSLPNAQACIIGSTTANGGSVYYQTLSPWLVPTGRPQDYGVTGQTLDVIWSNTANTFTGAKITPNTITGVQIAPGSVPLSDLQSSGYLGVVCSSNNTYAYQEVSLGALQVITRTTGALSLTAQNLSTIFNNEAGTPYNGSQLQANSVTTTQIQASGTAFPVCMGSVNANASLNCSLNIQSIGKNGTGLFKINFLNSVANTNYTCLPVVNDGSGSTAVTYQKATGYVVIRTMNLSGVNVDVGFDFEIKYIN